LNIGVWLATAIPVSAGIWNLAFKKQPQSWQFAIAGTFLQKETATL
jgi:hypothetical protein